MTPAGRPPPPPRPPVGSATGPRAALRALLARHWLLVVYVASVVLVGFQFGGRAAANNLRIFHWSFFHLVGGQDIYQPYPDLYYDVFKYSPTWALLFAPFALPPIAVGFFLWDLGAALLLYGVVHRLLPARQARVALAIAFFEFLAAMQHASNTNSVVAGLMILAFVALEEDRQVLGAFALATGALMKVYPVAGVTFALFHGRKVRFGLAVAGALAGLVALPLLVTSPAALLAQWRSWTHVVSGDTLERGFSVMQLMRHWTGPRWPNWPVQLAGTVVLVLPLALRRDRWTEPHFRRLFLCSLLLYCLIFNHQSERPSFVLGFTGIAIWYAMSPRTAVRDALMAFAFLGIPLLHSGLVPWRIREHVLLPRHVIAIPAVLLWLVMEVELLVRPSPRGGLSPAPADAAAPTAPSARAA
ncbi:MAG TPA: glycosyltransferase family 87 protein [Gemmatimonadales bacterium]|nr:glycosyltransferase family 87 protein [Gemmatimonadales bacterium]